MCKEEQPSVKQKASKVWFPLEEGIKIYCGLHSRQPHWWLVCHRLFRINDGKILAFAIIKIGKIALCAHMPFAAASFGTFIVYSLVGKNPLYIRLSIIYYSCFIFCLLHSIYGMFIFHTECFHFYAVKPCNFYCFLVSGWSFMLRNNMPNPK